MYQKSSYYISRIMNSLGFSKWANITEIKNMDIKCLENSDKKQLLSVMLEKLQESESKISIPTIITKYNSLFDANMIYSPYDRITSKYLEKCLVIVTKAYSKYDTKQSKNTDFLLLNDFEMKVREDLYYLKQHLPTYIGVKILEDIIKNIYRLD